MATRYPADSLLYDYVSKDWHKYVSEALFVCATWILCHASCHISIQVTVSVGIYVACVIGLATVSYNCTTDTIPFHTHSLALQTRTPSTLTLLYGRHQCLPHSLSGTADTTPFSSYSVTRQTPVACANVRRHQLGVARYAEWKL